MSSLKDLTGMVFGRLTVLYRIEDKIYKNRNFTQWLCRCSCDNKEIKVVGSALLRGLTQSCSCLKKERISAANKKYNTYVIDNDITYIKSSNSEEYIVIDTEDLNKIKQYCWRIQSNGYVVTSLKDHHMLLSRFILNVLYGELDVDHADKNPLNNTKSNLRYCTTSENSMNSTLRKNSISGITGVVWYSRDDLWQSQITFNYKNIYLGRYKDIEDAIVARLKAEKLYFGEFAPQKHLFEQYGI